MQDGLLSSWFASGIYNAYQKSDAFVVKNRSRTNKSDSAKAKPSTPEPQIGMEAYQKYLKEAMNPLKKEECTQTEGVVEIEFKLKEGKPYDFIIKQSFCESASKEAIRLIENGCLWIGEDSQTVELKVSF